MKGEKEAENLKNDKTLYRRQGKRELDGWHSEHKDGKE